jgi:hypothetical protein
MLIYFDPEDVKITYVNGVKFASVAWQLPVCWDAPQALKLSLTKPTQAWQLAREECRKRKIKEWYVKTYPDDYRENEGLRKHISLGGSITSFSNKKVKEKQC